MDNIKPSAESSDNVPNVTVYPNVTVSPNVPVSPNVTVSPNSVQIAESLAKVAVTEDFATRVNAATSSVRQVQPEFTPLTNAEIVKMNANQLRDYLAKYRDLVVALLADARSANERAELLAKQVEINCDIAVKCRDEMNRMQKTLQKVSLDVLLHTKGQLESSYSMFGSSMATIGFSMTEFMSDVESTQLLVQLARNYQQPMSCSREGVYITLNSPAAVAEYPNLDDYEYGVEVTIIDHKAKKYGVKVDFCRDFNEQHPEFSGECQGWAELTAKLDLIMCGSSGDDHGGTSVDSVHSAVSTFLKNESKQ